MYLKTFICFLIAAVLASCSTQTEKPYNAKLAIQNRVSEKTNIQLDTSNFSILLDSIHNTEGAFDLDYSWFVKLKFDSNYFDKLKETIRKTPNYGVIEYQYSKNWEKIDTAKVKGVWTVAAAAIVYYDKPGYNPEPIILSIDTVTKIFNFELIHL